MRKRVTFRLLTIMLRLQMILGSGSASTRLASARSWEQGDHPPAHRQEAAMAKRRDKTLCGVCGAKKVILPKTKDSGKPLLLCTECDGAHIKGLLVNRSHNE